MNIVLQGKVVKLIDFDAAAAYGELCHLKYSSSFGPPQLAQRLLQYGDGDAERWAAFCAELEPPMLASVANKTALTQAAAGHHREARQLPPLP